MQNAQKGHSAILSTFIKLPFVFKTFVLSRFEWPLKTGFTVYANVVAVLAIKVVSYTIPQKKYETLPGISGIEGMHFNQGTRQQWLLG